MRIFLFSFALCCLAPFHAEALGQRDRMQARQAVSQQYWNACMREALQRLHQGGAGGYSVKDDAHEGLARSFRFNARHGFPQFDASGVRPSFCSGAVYVAVLSALMHWERSQIKASAYYRRQFSPTAWQSLFPLRYKDGERAWGWANANGPGFAVLVHALGAGYSFTDWAQAKPYDIIKMWWTHELGGKERGHIAILMGASDSEVRFWSSNVGENGEQGGFGFKTIPRSRVKRVLFTRTTQPAAFAKAPQIGYSQWLNGLLSKPTTWQECLKRAGVR